MIKEKQNLRPLQFPQIFETYKTIKQNPWYPTEVNMTKDIFDWENASEIERRVVGSLLRGFTLAEAIIGDNWTTTISDMIPIAELVMLFKLFGDQEGTHGWAYDHLEATLDIDSYEAFKSDPTAQAKLQHIMDLHDTPYNAALHLAVFGGAIEGVSLYSSFGILLSFNQFNKFEGLGQIISWSAIDEDLHSQLAIKLFHHFTKTGELEKPSTTDIHEAFDIVVQNEIAFVKNAFGDADGIPSITKQEAIDYIFYRANLKLEELGYPKAYDVDFESVKRIASFFNNTIEGGVSHDFFATAKNGSGYTSKYERDFKSIDFNKVNNLINR